MEKPELLSASEKLAAQIEERLRDLVPVSSGRLKDSIKATVDEQGNLVDIAIDGESYYKFVDEGRAAGSFPNLGAIQDWASRKGIEPKAAFAIAVKIRDKGIEPLNLTDQLETSSELNDDSLEKAFAEDIEAQMSRVLNELFK